jgi:hypothetical protein
MVYGDRMERLACVETALFRFAIRDGTASLSNPTTPVPTKAGAGTGGLPREHVLQEWDNYLGLLPSRTFSVGRFWAD